METATQNTKVINKLLLIQVLFLVPAAYFFSGIAALVGDIDQDMLNQNPIKYTLVSSPILQGLILVISLVLLVKGFYLVTKMFRKNKKIPAKLLIMSIILLPVTFYLGLGFLLTI